MQFPADVAGVDDKLLAALQIEARQLPFKRGFPGVVAVVGEGAVENQSDSPVAESGQMPHRQRHRLILVGKDRIDLIDMPGGVVDADQRPRIAPPAPFGQLAAEIEREHPGERPFVENVKLIGGDDLQRPPPLRRLLPDGVEQIDRIPAQLDIGFRQNHRDCPPGGTRRVAQFIGDPEYLRRALRRDLPGVIQRPGDGRHRHAGPFGNLLNSSGFHNLSPQCPLLSSGGRKLLRS